MTNTDEAIEAEIRAFFEEFNTLRFRSLSSIEALEQLRGYFSDSCLSCAGGYSNAEQILANGYSVNGGPTAIEEFEVDAFRDQQVIFRVVVSTPAATVLDSSGAIVREYDSSESVTIVYTAQRQPSGSWLIVSDATLG